MDFSFNDTQHEILQLAARIFGDISTHEHLKEVEASEDRFDRQLWRELASAGLLGIGLPESVGGAGLGFLESCIVIEEAGRAAAAVPLLATTILGGAAIARFGSPQQQQRWLAPSVRGEAILTAALSEPLAELTDITTTATKTSGGFRLDGSKSYVPAGIVADAAIVPARLDEGGLGLFVVELGSNAVTREVQQPTGGLDEALLMLDGEMVADESVLVAGRGGAEALEWLADRGACAMCVQVAGACRAATALTARYTAERVQFDKPIATFQAVGQRAAEAYIDTEAVSLTAWQAAWRLSEELPATEELAIARFWADEGAQRVVHAAQHLHGGIGVDRDYPLHRYFLMVKHLSLALGGSTRSLLRLGEILATEPV